MRTPSSILQDAVPFLQRRATREGGAVVPPSLDAEAKAILFLIGSRPSRRKKEGEGDDEDDMAADARRTLVLLVLLRSFLAVNFRPTEDSPQEHRDLYAEVSALVEAGKKDWVPTFPSEPEEAEKKPAAGRRLSVLALERSASPDPETDLPPGERTPAADDLPG